MNFIWLNKFILLLVNKEDKIIMLVSEESLFKKIKRIKNTLIN